MNPTNRAVYCDGCGAAADDEHLRRRSERLELATRFRPIHIECLILYPAPLIRMEDYFYKASKNGVERTGGSGKFFEAVMKAAGVEAARGKDKETLLGELQRKGWYAAACCECPLEEAGIEVKAVAERFGETVAKRVKWSYRPKRIILAARSLDQLMGKLSELGPKGSVEIEDWMSD